MKISRTILKQTISKIKHMQNNKKASKYERLYSQIEALTNNNNGLIAHMATINAIVYHKMPDFFWCGFYLMDKNGELIIGPYQGPLACQKLKKNTGVCWAGINEKKTIIVPDVEKFPGHIACDSRSRSEIVIPVKINNSIIGVLDIDSKELNTFDEVDAKYLEKILTILDTHNDQ